MEKVIMNKIKGYNPKAISSKPLSPTGGGN